MIWNDTSERQGLVQDMEDLCGLGATGITGNTALFQQFTRWGNKWNKIGATIAIMVTDGWDLDDPAYTTYPSGTYAGTTNRDYAISSTEKILKIKSVGMAYDGTNYVKATAIDSTDFPNVVKDPNIDDYAPTLYPYYDPKANSIDIYPKFTQAQVDAGAKVYIEFLREPKDFATTGTDSQEPGFASPFHQLVSLGASYDYAKVYKPDLVPTLRADIYGVFSRTGIARGGLLNDMEDWYTARYPRHKNLSAKLISLYR